MPFAERQYSAKRLQFWKLVQEAIASLLGKQSVCEPFSVTMERV